MGQDYLDVEAADGINGGATSHYASSRRSLDTNVPIFSINVEDCSTAPSIIPLTPPSHANIANDGPGFNCSADQKSSSSASAIDAGATSNPTSWLSLLGGGGEHKGQSEQPRNIAALHAAVDDALSGRITANSGVSFCISRCSLQNPAVDSTKQQANPNVNSAVVQPAPDHQQAYCSRMITSAEITTHSENQGMVLTFVDVSYTLAKKRSRIYSRSSGTTRPGKQILSGITGCVMPGEMLALMGPSGSGKTTLLNLLGGRHHEAGEDMNIMKGEILYDGAPYSKTLKPRMGFVTQDDMLYPHLTVKETLTYAALLRLPASMSRQRKTHKADQILCQLGLHRCRDTIIGNAFLRGVSGGERKRVCIGHEIIIDPSLIFLDEPTSGLDSTTALRIMYLLQGLAKAGRSVVTTIHQPSSRAFYLFDKLLLLSEGHCVYFGKAHSAMQHFETCGFFPLVPMNPADFLLDLCSGNTFDIKVPTELLEEEGQVDSNEATFKIQVVQYLLECNAKEGAINNEIRGASLPLTFQQEGEQKATRKDTKREWAVGWGAQVAILLERGLRERRHDYLGWLKVTQVMATALLCGALWWHSNPNSPIDLQDQVGLLFFIGIFWGFFPLFNAIFTFPLERTLLAKERSSDMYRLSAYFIARSLSDLPLDLLLPTGFLTMVYFMTTLRMSAVSFLLTMLAVYLTVITSQGVGLLVGAALLDIKKATTFGSVLVIALMLAAGFFVQNIPKWVAWIKYFSFQSYCYKLLLKIQYYPHYNIQICSSKGASSMPCKQAMSLNEALHGMQLEPGLEEVWSLLALSLVSRLLAYLALRRVRITTIGKKLQHCVCCNHSKQL